MHEVPEEYSVNLGGCILSQAQLCQEDPARTAPSEWRSSPGTSSGRIAAPAGLRRRWAPGLSPGLHSEKSRTASQGWEGCLHPVELMESPPGWEWSSRSSVELPWSVIPLSGLWGWSWDCHTGCLWLRVCGRQWAAVAADLSHGWHDWTTTYLEIQGCFSLRKASYSLCSRLLLSGERFTCSLAYI